MNSPGSIFSLPLGFEQWPALAQSVTLAVMTFVSEDLTTVGSAVLAATASIPLAVAFLGCWLGIWSGDIGLYGLARGFGRPLLKFRWTKRWINPVSLERSEEWINKKGAALLFGCRLVPGTRLPTYLVSGFLKMPFAKFAIYTGIAALLWTAAIFALASVFGESLGLWLADKHQQIVWLLLAVVVGYFCLRVLVRICDPASRKRLGITLQRWCRWEFWPAWLFYAPVVLHGFWLMIKYRGVALPVFSNPGIKNGGLVGESKFETLAELETFAAEFTATSALIPSSESGERIRNLETAMESKRIRFPCILKPDQGQRGCGVKRVCTQAEAEGYLSRIQTEIVVQDYVDSPREAGIFYYRFPGESRGHLFGITRKIFPEIVGDGMRTIEELIEADPRARLISETYLARFGGRRREILPRAEKLPLVMAGNHAQGCIFLDGADLISEPLRQRIDEISNGLNGFYIGRYDVRYDSDDDLRAGKNFKIIELNGASAEATNIYDPKHTLFDAYRILFKQWDLVFAIGAANRDRGHQPIQMRQVWRDWRNFLRLAESLPQAD